MLVALTGCSRACTLGCASSLGRLAFHASSLSLGHVLPELLALLHPVIAASLPVVVQDVHALDSLVDEACGHLSSVAVHQAGTVVQGPVPLELLGDEECQLDALLRIAERVQQAELCDDYAVLASQSLKLGLLIRVQPDLVATVSQQIKHFVVAVVHRADHDQQGLPFCLGHLDEPQEAAIIDAGVQVHLAHDRAAEGASVQGAWQAFDELEVEVELEEADLRLREVLHL